MICDSGRNEYPRADLAGEMGDIATKRIEGGRRLREGARPISPLVSIISVVFRAREELPPLMESVFAACGQDTEIIVIDGGAQDGTVELLRGWDDKIDYWLSEPDRGIYDAMNKGLAAASGEYILHLNAGDRLRLMPRDILRKCLAEQIEVACFAVKMAGWGIFRPRTGLLLHIDNTWHHQGTFYRRRIHPGYDLKYRVFADFDCNQKLLKARKSAAMFDEVVAEQVSVGASGHGAVRDELYRIIRANFGTVFVFLAVVWAVFAGPRLWLKHLLNRFDSDLGARNGR